MPDKSDKLAGFRPKDDDLDKPLFDHRNDQSRRNNYPHHSTSSGSHPKKSPDKHKSKPHSKNNNKKPMKSGGSGGRVPNNSSQLPKSNIPSKQSQPSPIEDQANKLNDLPKRGEQSNPNKNDDHKSNSDNDTPKHDEPDNKASSNNNHSDDDNHKNDHDKDDDSHKTNNNDDNSSLTKDLKSDKDDSKDSKDKDKDDKDKDDKDSDDSKDKNDDDQKDSDANKSPLKKFIDFATGKSRSKSKSLKSLLANERKKTKLPKQPKGPVSGLKDLLDRIRKLVQRALLLLKMYLMALKAWAVMKLIALVQTILMFISNIIQWIVNLALTVWSFFTGLFGTIGGIVASFFSMSALLSVIAVVGTFFSSLFISQQQDTEMNEYKRICSSARPTKTDDGPEDTVSKGSGSWKKKGTKQYKTAHQVFKSWVKLGLDGGAAAGIVGWVAHEGGDFSIIDRAEGHFGNTEKEAGISEGVVPIPSGNYGTGGGGIYQFTPYHDFKPLRDKKWLSADAQSKHVTEDLNKNVWNPTPSIVGVSFMQFAAIKDPENAVLKWDGYERGALQPIMNTAEARKKDAKDAYKLFNGADYHFNKKKVQSWFHPGTPGGVTDTGGSTPDDPESARDPRCNPDATPDDDDDASSNSIVKTAEKEVKEGRHPSGTKYCSWFGVSTGTPWCAVFVSWVLHHTKGYEYVPKNAAVAGFASYFKSKNEDRSYKATPKPGWLIMFDWDGTHNSGTGNSHIGIVTGVKNGKISTIEGNDADNGETITKALKNEYSIGDKRISMYAVPHKK